MKLCKCGWKLYGNARCPNCNKSSRQERIAKRVEKTNRIIKQIQTLSIPEDRGLGDTIARIKSNKTTDINKTITRLLASCSCNLDDAVDVLNERYPNARNLIQPDSSGSST